MHRIDRSQAEWQKDLIQLKVFNPVHILNSPPGSPYAEFSLSHTSPAALPSLLSPSPQPPRSLSAEPDSWRALQEPTPGWVTVIQPRLLHESPQPTTQ